ncbi:MAG: hypothetical protein ABEI77_02515, partial [Halorientalis sp.]
MTDNRGFGGVGSVLRFYGALLVGGVLLVTLELWLVVGTTNGANRLQPHSFQAVGPFLLFLLGWPLVASVPSAWFATRFEHLLYTEDSSLQSRFGRRDAWRTLVATTIAHLILALWWFCLTLVAFSAVVIGATGAELLGWDTLTVWYYAQPIVFALPLVATILTLPLVGFAGAIARQTDVPPRQAWRESLRATCSSFWRTDRYLTIQFLAVFLPTVVLVPGLESESGPAGYLLAGVFLLVVQTLGISVHASQFERDVYPAIGQSSTPFFSVSDRIGTLGRLTLGLLVVTGLCLGAVRIADVQFRQRPSGVDTTGSQSPEALLASATAALDHVDHRVVTGDRQGNRSIVMVFYDHDDQQVLLVENQSSIEGGRTVGVVYADERTYASCYTESRRKPTSLL